MNISKIGNKTDPINSIKNTKLGINFDNNTHIATIDILIIYLSKYPKSGFIFDSI